MTTPHRDDAAGLVAVVTALSLVVTPLAPVSAQAPAAPVAPAAGRVTAAQPSSAAPVAPDLGWPRHYVTAKRAAVTLYQPQIAEWTDQRHMTAYSAVSYLPTGADKAMMGTVRVEAETSVSVEERLVSFSDFKIADASFPTLAKDQVQDLIAEVMTAVPRDERVLALDRVLASVDMSQIRPKNVEGVKADPPTVFFSTTPAVLLNLDGDPIWGEVTGTDLRYAINTNWDLFEHGPSKTFYLLVNDGWMQTTDLLKGTWAPAAKLPPSFSKLPADDDNWKEVRAAVPGRTLSKAKAPRVYASTVPAELILLTGAPSYLTVEGTKLLWVNNTESDVFRLGKGGPVYYLVAGRWFTAPDFTGPWTFATPSLPEDFKKIPLEHDRSRVLASVPGTEQAAEAVLLAQIPQTARVNRKDVKAPEVKYQGDPQFQPIEKTTVSRAVNTDKDIIKVGDLYYMCFQGVWFMSRTATGPWEVTGEVPKAIYEIPASSPSHSVTYVTVQESHGDAVVFATAAAYSGLMIAWGCAVWGTGYYYPPYVWYGGPRPIYYPYYPTYGYSAWYNPWSGTYGRGMVAYGPYGGAGVAARYNPYTGTYSRSAAAWGPYGGARVSQAYNPRTGTVARGGVAYGPYGARGAAEAYNPRTGAYGATRQGSGVYGSWGTTGVQRGDDWARTSRVTNDVTGATTRVTRGDGGAGAVTRNTPGGGAGIARTESGDVYAGRDGNVYRRQGDSWQKYDDGGWSGVEGPTQAQRDQARQQAQATGAQARDRAAASGWDPSTRSQVTRDSAARAQGAQRTRDASSIHGGGGGARAGGSYRPRGGGRRR